MGKVKVGDPGQALDPMVALLEDIIALLEDYAERITALEDRFNE